MHNLNASQGKPSGLQYSEKVGGHTTNLNTPLIGHRLGARMRHSASHHLPTSPSQNGNNYAKHMLLESGMGAVIEEDSVDPQILE